MRKGVPSRRRLLQVLGVGVLIGVTGCSTRNNGQSEPSTTSLSGTSLTAKDTLIQTPTATLSPTPTSEKIAANDGDAEDRFGWSTALARDGSTALIGAPHDDSNGSQAGSAYVFTTSGGGWAQQAKLTPGDGDSGDIFGRSVSLSGDGSTALIGTYGDDPNGSNAGSAYVFATHTEEWTQQAKLIPDDGDTGDWFGRSASLSVDGSTALIGAPTDEDPNGTWAGSAYVFTTSGGDWLQRAKITPDDGDSDDRFGMSVALSANGLTALIGADNDDDPNGTKAGSAYVFTKNGGDWTQQAKLTPDDGDSEDWFGRSAALAGDGGTALIGAALDEDPDGYRAGSAYVFARSGGNWIQQAKLTPDDGDAEDRFGHAVSLAGDGSTALIGRYGDDAKGEDAGSAYVFTTSGEDWLQQTKLTPDDGDSKDHFGLSVGLSANGSTALIGAFTDEDPNGAKAGSAYVFSL